MSGWGGGGSSVFVLSVLFLGFGRRLGFVFFRNQVRTTCVGPDISVDVSLSVYPCVSSSLSFPPASRRPTSPLLHPPTPVALSSLVSPQLPFSISVFPSYLYSLPLALQSPRNLPFVSPQPPLSLSVSLQLPLAFPQSPFPLLTASP